MKKGKYLWILLSLLYFDLIFNLFTYDSYLRTSIINIFLFGLVNSFIIYLITSIWNDNVNKIIEEASLDFFKGEKTGEETACEIDLKVKEISFK